MQELDICQLPAGRNAVMKRAAIYVRVSTLEQAQEGYSIGEQKERLIAYCKAHDWIIANIYVDGGYSGSNLNRPGIQKLMQETEEFDVVLVYKLDRLSRSQRDTLYLIEEVFLPHGVDFVSMQECFDTSSPFGKAMIGLLAVFAQLEREQIKERTKMGRMARAKQGYYHGGGHIPVGYEYIDGKLVINPYEADQVRKIYEWYISGESINSITLKLQEAKYTTKYGEYKSWSSVRYILNNDTYLGKVHFGDIVSENAHEPIITEDQFMTAKKMQKKRSSKYRNNFKANNLLTGMMFCEKCGSRYYLRHCGGYAYYACYSRTRQSPKMAKADKCTNKIWRCDALEALLDERVTELFKSPELVKQISSAKPPKPVKSNDNKIIEKRIKEIDKQIGKLMQLYQLDDMPADVLGNNISKLYNEKTSLQQSIIKEETNEKELTFDLAMELLKDASNIWEFADRGQKRRILQSIIDRIVIDEENIKIEWAF